MSWSALATGIRALVTADTGVGGLWEDGGAVSIEDALFTDEAPENQSPPFAVISSTGAVETDAFARTCRIQEHGFQVDVFTDKRLGTTIHDAYVDRFVTVLRRVAPTVTGWNTGHSFLNSQQPSFIEDNLRRSILDFTAFLSKN
jgi:hypothetical protein